MHTYRYVPQSRPWGVANSFGNGTIDGQKYVFVGTEAGLANVRLLPGQPLINQSWSRAYLLTYLLTD